MFKKAVRENIKIKIAVSGPSGAGKTYSSLMLAKGLTNGKIALIDTENGSASLYSHLLDFDVHNITAPYLSSKYIEAINAAVKGGYDTIVIDSISHQWSGEGGILDRKSIKDSIPGTNSFTNWKDFTIEHNNFIASILNANANIICTMRSKTDYVMEINDKGKQAPKKVGLATIQRDGVDYEYSIVFDVSINHIASISKDRTGIFDGRYFKITPETGIEIKNYLNSGVIPPKSFKDSLVESALGVLDLDLRDKIVNSILNENNAEKLNKYKLRVDEILLSQTPLEHHQV